MFGLDERKPLYDRTDALDHGAPRDDGDFLFPFLLVLAAGLIVSLPAYLIYLLITGLLK